MFVVALVVPSKKQLKALAESLQLASTDSWKQLCKNKQLNAEVLKLIQTRAKQGIEGRLYLIEIKLII